MTRQALIVVTHLLGSGHLVRARHLAAALSRAGWAVTLASGGMPLATHGEAAFDSVQLPPVRVEGVDFRHLLDEDGSPIDEARLAARRAMLLELAQRLAPQLLIVEHFPFGRRQLAHEFLGVIEAVRSADPRACVLSSIRDVLVAPRADRIVQAEQRIIDLFDGVLVHGDADFLPLEASWPVSPDLAERLHYTGYLASSSLRTERSGPGGVEAVSLRSDNDGGEILVSGGGSAAALPLFEIALAAAALSDPARPWRILAGRGLPETDFIRLQALAPSNASVEWSRPDFAALLAHCAVSISQAGYNTVLDLLAARRPAIVVPFDEGNETEQTIRAGAMQRAGLAQALPLSHLTPLLLAEAVADAVRRQAPPHATIDRDGAARIADVVEMLVTRRRQPP